MNSKMWLAGILAVGMWWQVSAAEAVWLTDAGQAQTQAKAENKLVLLDFTGSDWCSWCIKFKKDALETDEFKAFAAKKLVLVEVDFPNNKPQSEAQKKANQALSDKYKVEGYPTFVILDSSGKEIGRQTGYLKGGGKAFVEKIEGFQK